MRTARGQNRKKNKIKENRRKKPIDEGADGGADGQMVVKIIWRSL